MKIKFFNLYGANFAHAAKKGFTLIELLVVIAIISLLSSVVMASVSSARIKSRDSRRVQDLYQIRKALDLYFDDNHTYPPYAYWLYSNSANWNTLQTALAPYLTTLPKDPRNNTAGPWATGNYTYAYGVQPGGKNYDLVAQFEDTSNPNRCQVKGWIFHYTGASANRPWCAGFPNSWTYSPYLYADH
jgi:general secretion pathway protein G